VVVQRASNWCVLCELGPLISLESENLVPGVQGEGVELGGGGGEGRRARVEEGY
jgi:hypothetical protein